MTRLIVIFAVLHAANTQRENYSISSSGFDRYEKISLLEPKFKSKQLAGLGWYSQPGLESGAGQNRHLEWLESSANDSESAEPTEKGFLAEWFGEEDDESNVSDVATKEDKIDSGVRQHRKKYVKVDKMLLPLLLAYKLKFFTMVPVLIGAMVLLVGTTGLAGFFFALFAAAAGLHVKG